MSDRKSILVCDDESHIVHVVALKLRNAGYEVLSAADGQEGLELARRHRPDLIVTDFQMPRLTGVEMCAALRSEPGTRDIPALMLTARGYRLDPSEVRNARIADVLSKPFSPREVLAKVQELLTASASTSDPQRDPEAAAA